MLAAYTEHEADEFEHQREEEQCGVGALDFDCYKAASAACDELAADDANDVAKT